MDKHWCTVCAVVFACGVFAHFNTVYALTLEKGYYEKRPGTCPKERPPLGSYERCHHDYQCPPDCKCCPYDCGSFCVPIKKEGECPIPSWPYSAWPHIFWGNICPSYCSCDFDCPHHYKCCSNGCGQVCTAPVPGVPGKPGQCPPASQNTQYYYWFCLDLCGKDEDCLGAQKCCHTACGGHACTDPC